MISEAVLMDNMEYMAKFPDGYFDLAVVDPPYGNESSFNNRRKLKSYDNEEPKAQYYFELFRISKNQIIWGANYLRNYDLKGGGIVWNKLGVNTNHRKQAPTIGDCEFAFCSMSNNIKMFSYAWMGNVLGNDYQINPLESTERFHPSQKPVALYDWIYAKYLPEGGKVLDTHLGSGSNRIAADKAGNIDFYSCELDPDYHADQEKRWKNYKAQLVLAF